MKRLLLSIVILLTTIIFSYSQEYSLDTLRTNIEYRDSVLVRKMGSQARIDTLNSQVRDLKAIIKILADSCDVLTEVHRIVKEELDICHLMTSPDTTVFHTSFAQMPVPSCLTYHIELLTKIAELNKSLNDIYAKINDLTRILEGDEVKRIIAAQIENDVYALSDAFTAVLQMNLTTLSAEQMAYLKPGLTEKFNNLLTYFE